MKTPSLHPSFRRLALAISAFTVLALSSRAFASAVEVTAGDITGGDSYNFTVAEGPYQLNPPPYEIGNYGNNGGNGPGLIDATNLTYVTDVGADYLAGVSANSAHLILGFDFSGSGYAPTSLTLTSNAVDFSGDSTFTFSYSTDGFTYTPFASVGPDPGNLDIAPQETVSLAGLPSDVYVEIAVSIPANPDYPNGSLNDSNSQIGRAYPEGATALDYSFTVAATPEPSTFALVGLGLAIFAFGVVRRAKAISI